MRHQSLNSLDARQSRIEGSHDAAWRQPLLNEYDTVPEADDEHGDDQKGNITHLYGITLCLYKVMLCGLLNGLEVLPQFVVVAVENLDKIDGRDGGRDVLGGGGQITSLSLDCGLESLCSEGKDKRGHRHCRKEDKGQLPGVVEGDS